MKSTVRSLCNLQYYPDDDQFMEQLDGKTTFEKMEKIDEYSATRFYSILTLPQALL